MSKKHFSDVTEIIWTVKPVYTNHINSEKIHARI